MTHHDTLRAAVVASVFIVTGVGACSGNIAPSPKVVGDDVSVACQALLLIDPNVPDVVREACVTEEEIAKLMAKPTSKLGVKLAKPIVTCVSVSSAKLGARSRGVRGHSGKSTRQCLPNRRCPPLSRLWPSFLLCEYARGAHRA